MNDVTNGSLSARFDASSTRSSPVATPVSSTPSASLPSPASEVAKVEVGDEGELSFEEAVKRREQKELEQATLMCSLENKDACVSELSFFFPFLFASFSFFPQCSVELMILLPFSVLGLMSLHVSLLVHCDVIGFARLFSFFSFRSFLFGFAFYL